MLFDRARREYETFARLQPELVAGYKGIGVTCLLSEEEATLGLEALEKARELQPSDDMIALSLALLLERTGEGPRAAKLYAEVARYSTTTSLRVQAEQHWRRIVNLHGG